MPRRPFALVTALPTSTKPSHIPAVVGRTAPSVVEVVGDTWVRGYHAIRWEYTLHVASDTVGKALITDYGSVQGQYAKKLLADRQQSIMLMPGRRQQVTRSGSTWWEWSDPSSYTTLELTERPLVYGPLPHAWVRSALARSPQVQVPSPKLPSLGALHPVEVVSSITPGGTVQVWVTWSIPFSGAEAKKRIDRDIAHGAPWRLRGSRYSCTDRGSDWTSRTRLQSPAGLRATSGWWAQATGCRTCAGTGGRRDTSKPRRGAAEEGSYRPLCVRPARSAGCASIRALFTMGSSESQRAISLFGDAAEPFGARSVSRAWRN